jgi:hypothetical protein
LIALGFINSCQKNSIKNMAEDNLAERPIADEMYQVQEFLTEEPRQIVVTSLPRTEPLTSTAATNVEKSFLDWIQSDPQLETTEHCWYLGTDWQIQNELIGWTVAGPNMAVSTYAVFLTCHTPFSSIFLNRMLEATTNGKLLFWCPHDHKQTGVCTFKQITTLEHHTELLEFVKHHDLPPSGIYCYVSSARERSKEK